MSGKFYITSAIPYVNAAPHIGHALEFVQTNTIARYHKLLGMEVLSLCGGDENALKNVQAAEKENTPIQKFVDRNNDLFKELAKQLNASFDVWQKGSDTDHHYQSSQKLWQLCDSAGDIYQQSYEGLYCVGCEVFYAPDELNEKGECYEHPGKKLEKVKEKNYFFRLSKYTDFLKQLISSDKLVIIPEKRKNEVLAFLDKGLQDISISRSNERAKNWGVPVPGDPTQRIYVWFDALNIYQSGVGFGWDDTVYNHWWPADVHVIGKGITRFHAIYWIAFLLSAKLHLPKCIFVHEYFTVNGQKMSKTLGNVIDPFALIQKFSTDPLRYYFLAKFSPFNDGDFSEKEFAKTYNADLANGLGNLVARVAKLAENETYSLTVPEFASLNTGEFNAAMNEFRFHDAIAFIWEHIKHLDIVINELKPWTLTGAKRKEGLKGFLPQILEIAVRLQPFLPDTAEKIIKQFEGPTIKVQPPLFPRII